MARCRYARNTADFKSKVALEALREQQPIHEIANRDQVHGSQVTEWKRALQGNASNVFECTSHPFGSVVTLTENDAPVFELGLTAGFELCEKPFDRVEFGIDGFGARELCLDFLEASDFRTAHIAENVILIGDELLLILHVIWHRML